MKKSRSTILPVILLIIAIMLLGFLSFIYFYNLKNGNVGIFNKKTEEEYVEIFTKMGEEMYSEYYYKITAEGKTEEELKEFLEKFKNMGLHFNLVELEKYNDENKRVINQFLNQNKKCKKGETEVIIYPKEPYTKTDFTSDFKMNCGMQN